MQSRVAHAAIILCWSVPTSPDVLVWKWTSAATLRWKCPPRKIRQDLPDVDKLDKFLVDSWSTLTNTNTQKTNANINTKKATFTETNTKTNLTDSLLTAGQHSHSGDHSPICTYLRGKDLLNSIFKLTNSIVTRCSWFCNPTYVTKT